MVCIQIPATVLFFFDKLFLFITWNIKKNGIVCQWNIDKEQNAFIIRRNFSAKQLVQHTKTRKIHVIPCHSEFEKIMDKMPVGIDSPYSRDQGPGS
jgi:hypothetical protein